MFLVLCSVAGILFLPCLIPCFIRLIHSVVQGMQIAIVPMDSEGASGGNASKIMWLGEGKYASNAAEALAKSENQATVKMNNVVF